MRLDVKCKQSGSSAGENDLANRDQNFGYWPLQSLNFFNCSGIVFPRLPFCGLKVIEVLRMYKMRFGTKCKQTLSGAPGNDLTNRDQNFGYWSLQSLKFFNCFVILFPHLPFWGLKVTEVAFLSKVRLKWPYRCRPNFRVSITPKFNVFYCCGFLFPSFAIMRPEMDRGVVFPQN